MYACVIKLLFLSLKMCLVIFVGKGGEKLLGCLILLLPHALVLKQIFFFVPITVDSPVSSLMSFISGKHKATVAHTSLLHNRLVYCIPCNQKLSNLILTSFAMSVQHKLSACCMLGTLYFYFLRIFCFVLFFKMDLQREVERQMD